MERRLCVQAKRALAIIPIITISKDEDEDEDHCPGKIANFANKANFFRETNL